MKKLWSRASYALRGCSRAAAFVVVVLASCRATTSNQPVKTTTEPPSHESPAQRDERIRQTLGQHCRFERACGPLWGVDCDAASDGPYYYVDPGSLTIVARCGGYCMGGHCENCPPAGWTCPTY